MGTRHLIMVIKDNKPVVAQYGQWDGYPEGQGARIIEFLQDEYDEEFISALDNLRFITDEEYGQIWGEFGVGPGERFVSLDVAKRRDNMYPELSRDTGAGILRLIKEWRGNLGLIDSSSFAGDSLFCEYAYVIDTDSNMLEVYEGFNYDPPPDGERFSHLGPLEKYTKICYPVRFITKFQIGHLPSADEFVDTVYEESKRRKKQNEA